MHWPDIRYCIVNQKLFLLSDKNNRLLKVLLISIWCFLIFHDVWVTSKPLFLWMLLMKILLRLHELILIPHSSILWLSILHVHHLHIFKSLRVLFDSCKLCLLAKCIHHVLLIWILLQSLIEHRRKLLLLNWKFLRFTCFCNTLECFVYVWILANVTKLFNQNFNFSNFIGNNERKLHVWKRVFFFVLKSLLVNLLKLRRNDLRVNQHPLFNFILAFLIVLS